jgi:hypothetical protein
MGREAFSEMRLPAGCSAIHRREKLNGSGRASLRLRRLPVRRHAEAADVSLFAALHADHHFLGLARVVHRAPAVRLPGAPFRTVA